METVDWAGLEHAYGSAEDVPANLRALVSRDEEERHGAFGELYASIVHQGTRYEASAYAVPPLLDLLADPATPDRWLVGQLLVLIAIGSDEAWVPDGLPVGELRSAAAGGAEALRRYKRRESLDEADQRRMFTYVDLRAYEAVGAGLPLLRRLVGGDDADLSTVAAYTLGWYPEPEPAASIAALATVATDPARGEEEVAVAVVAAGMVGADGADRLAATALDDERAVVRWAGAVASARLHGPTTGERAVTELLHWAGGASQPDTRLPYLEGDLGGYASLALRQLGPAYADAAFDAHLARLPKVQAMPALTVVDAALRLAFPAGPVPAGTPFAALDDRQRRLVRVLAAAPGSWCWSDRQEFGNFSMAVGDYGLPNSNSRMREYVQTA
ncbi:hypothetical protein AB0M79_33335 [Polymorphospora sp. NPDC051019]|uniref:hypothetical protein n=1 Tax=Polymorphospora sp. NPDC051019 TaxID=3155725 RepID=UPI0034486E31